MSTFALLKSGLSHGRRQLLEQCQDLNFGRIEGLVIRQGEPILSPPPRAIREIKFGAENGPRSELGRRDFVLKPQVTELFHTFDQLGNATINLLEVRHGLPFRMLVEESLAAERTR